MIRMIFEASRLQHGQIGLRDDEVHYLIQVMRVGRRRLEAMIEGVGLFEAQLDEAGVSLRIGKALGSPPRLRLAITVAPALIKHDLIGQVIEKGTEVGVVRFQPWVAERSVVRAAGPSKLQRWRRIAKEASEQCRRAAVPDILPVAVGVEDLGRDEDELGVLWDPDGEPLDHWWAASAGTMKRVKTVVGPEGGITEDERAAFHRHGFCSVRLGPQTFRAENAGVFGALLLLWLNGELIRPVTLP